MAHSSDGYIGRTGERTSVTTDASWKRIYKDRENVDALMVGIGTVLIDNPLLTSRTSRTPVRVIVDTNARLPVASTLVQTTNEAPLWLLTSVPAPELESHGVNIIQCPTRGGHIDMSAALEKLFALGIKTMISEGGARLAQTLNDERLIDQLLLIEGQIALGGGVPLPIFTNFTPIREEPVETDMWRYYEARR